MACDVSRRTDLAVVWWTSTTPARSFSGMRLRITLGLFATSTGVAATSRISRLSSIPPCSLYSPYRDIRCLPCSSGSLPTQQGLLFSDRFRLPDFGNCCSECELCVELEFLRQRRVANSYDDPRIISSCNAP